jgi:hypothetical protein
MTNPWGDSLPKGNVVVDENFLVSTVIKVALLGIPEVCPNVIGCVASLNVYYLFHDWPLRRLRFAAVHTRMSRKIDEMAAMFGSGGRIGQPLQKIVGAERASVHPVR